MTENDEARRYRRAAEAALEQLDWCVLYLRNARKSDLARAVSRNRDHIRQIMGPPRIGLAGEQGQQRLPRPRMVVRGYGSFCSSCFSFELIAYGQSRGRRRLFPGPGQV